MDEETEINNNDLNNNTDFEEEALAADHMAEMADMNPNDLMENMQKTLLKEANIVRERIGYRVSIEQVYHYLEVAVDHDNRVQRVVDDLLERINNGEFPEAMAEETEAMQEPSLIDLTSSPIGDPELNESLAYVAEDESDELEEDEDGRARPGKRKVEVENRQLQNEHDAMLDQQLEIIGNAVEVIQQEQHLQVDMNDKMEEDLQHLAALFPNKSLDEMRGMYLSICTIEKDNTLNMLAQQMYDAEEIASPPKRPKLARGDGDAAETHFDLLNQMCEILSGLGLSRQHLRLKGDELNWDQESINTFIATQLQNGDGAAMEAGPSNQQAGPSKQTAGPSNQSAGPSKQMAGPSNQNPPSPQPGPSHEHDSEDEVVEQLEDSPEISQRIADLMNMLPDADPEYIRHKVHEVAKEPLAYEAFVLNAVEEKKYPKREEYEKRKANENAIKTFTGRMNVTDFLLHFPNPQEHFESRSEGNKDILYQQHCLAFLKERYSKIHVKTITEIFRKSYNLTKAIAALDSEKPKRATRRSRYESRQPTEQHLFFLQEVTYINKKAEIQAHFKAIEDARKAAFDHAKERNELLECPVCCENECLFEDMTSCAEGHLFCKTCVKQYAETGIGDSKNKFPCLDNNCTSEFPLQVLKSVLDSKAFACLARRLQTEEIRAAMITDLETCPFCPYSYIPEEDSLVFECQEESCKKASCRKCKAPNHLPLKCEEVEKDDQIEARRLIEERMTEALIRECPKCKNKFVKTDGCNKMTCSCGTKICYICRQVIKDYNHFHQGPNGAVNPDSRCPLYSTNDQLHVDNVIAEGEKAKKELESKGVTLKHDPTRVAPQATGAGGAAAGGAGHRGYFQLLDMRRFGPYGDMIRREQRVLAERRQREHNALALALRVAARRQMHAMDQAIADNVADEMFAEAAPNPPPVNQRDRIQRHRDMMEYVRFFAPEELPHLGIMARQHQPRAQHVCRQPAPPAPAPPNPAPAPQNPEPAFRAPTMVNAAVPPPANEEGIMDIFFRDLDLYGERPNPQPPVLRRPPPACQLNRPGAAPIPGAPVSDNCYAGRLEALRRIRAAQAHAGRDLQNRALPRPNLGAAPAQNPNDILERQQQFLGRHVAPEPQARRVIPPNMYLDVKVPTTPEEWRNPRFRIIHGPPLPEQNQEAVRAEEAQVRSQLATAKILRGINSFKSAIRDLQPRAAEDTPRVRDLYRRIYDGIRLYRRKLKNQPAYVNHLKSLKLRFKSLTDSCRQLKDLKKSIKRERRAARNPQPRDPADNLRDEGDGGYSSSDSDDQPEPRRNEPPVHYPYRVTEVGGRWHQSLHPGPRQVDPRQPRSPPTDPRQPRSPQLDPRRPRSPQLDPRRPRSPQPGPSRRRDGDTGGRDRGNDDASSPDSDDYTNNFQFDD